MNDIASFKAKTPKNFKNAKIGVIQKYINLYLHKRITQNALRQRYTNSQLLLGNGIKTRIYLLAEAVFNIICF